MWLNDSPLQGFKLHPAFKRVDADGKTYIKDYIYIARDCISGTQTSSKITLNGVSNPKGTRLYSSSVWPPKSRDDYRTAVKSYNSALSMYDIWALSATQMLYLAEYADLDIQSTIGRGITDVPYNSSLPIENPNSPYHSLALNLGVCFKDKKAELLANNGTLAATATFDGRNICADVNYRWEHNLWGGVYKIYVDGVNIQNDNVSGRGYKLYASNKPSDYKDGKLDDSYKAYGNTFCLSISAGIGMFPTKFKTDCLDAGLLIGDLTADSATATSGIPDYTALNHQTIHPLACCIGCVYDWEYRGYTPDRAIMGGTGIFQYEFANDNNDENLSSQYSMYTSAKAMYIPTGGNETAD